MAFLYRVEKTLGNPAKQIIDDMYNSQIVDENIDLRLAGRFCFAKKIL